jgi:hypothetical protein
VQTYTDFEVQNQYKGQTQQKEKNNDLAYENRTTRRQTVSQEFEVA